MATAKNTRTTKTSAEVVTRDTTEEATKPTGILKDGIYTEEVTLTNGVPMPCEVIVDMKKLPATYGMLISEGNAAALTIAALTARTRRMLDLLGATMEDLNEVLPAVIARAREASESVIDGE